MNHTPNFFVPADHRIQLALPGELRKIAPVLFERLIGAFGVLTGDALMAADLLECAQQPLLRQAEFSKHTAFLDHGKEHMFDTEKVVLQRPLLFFRFGQDLIKSGSDVDLTRATSSSLDLGKFCKGLLGRLLDCPQRQSGLLAQRRHDPTLLFQQRQKEMLDI